MTPFAERRQRVFPRLVAVLGALAASGNIGAAQRVSGQQGEAPPALRVVVTVAPLKGIVEPLLPPGSSVRMLVAPGRSEHGQDLTPGDLGALADADVVVYVGLGLEPTVEKALRSHPRPGRREVCFATSVGIGTRAEGAKQECGERAENSGKAGHAHEAHAACEHAVDPHLWLDPVLVEQFVPVLAGEIRAAVGAGREAAPAFIEDLGAREAGMLRRVREVDRAWRERLAPWKGQAIVTHHNAFSRPAERYGLRVAAVIRGTENAEPSPAQIAAVVETIRREKVRAIFVEPQFGAGVGERIARAAGVRVASLDPLGDGDWFKMMKANLESLERNLSER
jgi:zinc transport system substrate-binding protein